MLTLKSSIDVGINRKPPEWTNLDARSLMTQWRPFQEFEDLYNQSSDVVL